MHAGGTHEMHRGSVLDDDGMPCWDWSCGAQDLYSRLRLFRRLLSWSALVFFVLAAMFTGVLWLDSYRVRKPVPFSPGLNFIGFEIPMSPQARRKARTGLNWTHHFGNSHTIGHLIFRIRTQFGQIRLRYDTGIKSGTPVTEIDNRWSRFRYRQWMWVMGETQGGKYGRVVRDEYQVREFHMPIWCPLVLFAAFPCFFLVISIRSRHRRRAYSREGHCKKCGYNLFTNTSGICPECGTPIPKEVREKLAAEPSCSNAKLDTHGSQSVGEQDV